MSDWKDRTRLYIGDGALGRLAAARVAVVGLGGVGAYAAEMLVRAGVGHMVIIDADTVSLTNKNRQLLALDSTLGRLKAEVLEERLRDINPEAEITPVPVYLEEENIGAVLDPLEIDYVVDAIDTVKPKLMLIRYCLGRGLPLVSSMGAGARMDLTKIRIADISKTFNCTLAAVLRKRLRKMGIRRGFKAVFSEELPDPSAVVEVREKNKLSNVGTISYLPAVFGCACAQTVIGAIVAKESGESVG